MKKIHFILSLTLGVILILCPSCYTTEKIDIKTPETADIYVPGTIQNPTIQAQGNKSTKIEISSDMYCAYLLVRPTGIDTWIPLGLDYRHNSHYGTKIALGTGAVLAGTGTAGMVGSLVPIIAGNDSPTIGAIMGAAGAATLIGVGMGFPAQVRMRQTAYDYNFGYVKKQIIELPKLSATLLHPNPVKNTPEQSQSGRSERKKATSGKDISERQIVGSKAKRSRSDFAQIIAGTYIGSGKLLLKGKQDDFFPEIKVIVEKIDRTNVSVRIVESDEDFFETSLPYQVSTTKKGEYLLSIKNLPEAKIIITKNGSMTFLHSKVNIDNQIYTLSISAKRE